MILSHGQSLSSETVTSMPHRATKGARKIVLNLFMKTYMVALASRSL